MGDDTQRNKRKERTESKNIVRTHSASNATLTMYYDKKTMQYTIYAQYHQKNKQGEIRTGFPLLWWWGANGEIANERFHTFCREVS